MQNKKVLILGLGLNDGGVGSAKYFANKGDEVLVTDIKNEEDLKPSIEKLKDFPEIKYQLGGHRNEDIDWADLIIRNQAIKSTSPYLEYARKQNKKIATDVGIFLSSIDRDQLIAVTGTKGKSTTSSLIYEVLKSSGKNVMLIGNIGKSVLDSIGLVEPETLVVLETSSFQLESFDKREFAPKYGVITNIYPDHLNYYSSMEEYIAAKKLISKHQTENDYLFINEDDKTINSQSFLEGIKSQIILYSPQDLPNDFKPQLPGEFNLSNLAGALAVAKTLGIDEKIILETLQNFKGVEFRMELIKDWNGVKIYNNTTATAPEPAIESLKVFPNCILICGGMDKGLDFSDFAKAIDQYSKEVYFLEGDATDNLESIIQNSELIKGTYDDLEKLLTDVKNNAKPGDIILFSPGATSFNLFQNEFDRGRKFNEAVEKIFG